MVDNNEFFVITPHALERFQDRWREIRGSILPFDEAMRKLQGLLMRARPEKDTKKTAERRERHDGAEKFLIAPPWRFVFSGKRLMTCEIVPDDVHAVANPRVRASLSRQNVVMEITENITLGCTTLTKIPSERKNRLTTKLSLPGMPEINAIIKVLRVLGITVIYERFGAVAFKKARLEVIIPERIKECSIETVPGRKIVFIVFGRSELLPLGKTVVRCFGITKQDVEAILQFLRNEI